MDYQKGVVLMRTKIVFYLMSAFITGCPVAHVSDVKQLIVDEPDSLQLHEERTLIDNEYCNDLPPLPISCLK